MTRYTAILIQTRDDVRANAYEQAGKWGLMVELADESPSHRPRVLLTSAAAYVNADDALRAGEAIIEQVRAMDLNEGAA